MLPQRSISHFDSATTRPHIVLGIIDSTPRFVCKAAPPGSPLSRKLARYRAATMSQGEKRTMGRGVTREKRETRRASPRVTNGHLHRLSRVARAFDFHAAAPRRLGGPRPFRASISLLSHGRFIPFDSSAIFAPMQRLKGCRCDKGGRDGEERKARDCEKENGSLSLSGVHSPRVRVLTLSCTPPHVL